jgi:hypothetical protein
MAKVILLIVLGGINCLGILAELLFSGFFTINLSSEAKGILRNVSTIEVFNYLVTFFFHAVLPIIAIDARLDCSLWLRDRNEFSYRRAVLWSSLPNLIGKIYILFVINRSLLPIAVGFAVIIMGLCYVLGTVKSIEKKMSWLFGTQPMGGWRRAGHNLMSTLFCLLWIMPFFWIIAGQFINQELKPSAVGDYAFFASFYVAMMVVALRLVYTFRSEGSQLKKPRSI